MPAMSSPHLHDHVMEVARMPDPHNQPITQAKLHWYRIPLDRAVLAELNQRSDAGGLPRRSVISASSLQPGRCRGMPPSIGVGLYSQPASSSMERSMRSCSMRSMSSAIPRYLKLAHSTVSSCIWSAFLEGSTTCIFGRAIKSITNTHFTSQTTWKSFCQ